MSSRLRATRFGVALASFIALAACDQAPTSSFAIPSLRMPASGAGCDGRSCILFSSPAPLNSAIAFADSSSADILLASATLTGKTGDSLTLRLTGEAAVLAALSPDELLTVDIDGVPLTIALHDAVNGSVVHRFLDSRPVTVRYSINRRMQHALRGRIMLAQETVAAVADLQTPWLSDAMGRGARLDVSGTDPQCSQLMNVSAEGVYCDVGVFISPYAPADAFLANGATFQSDAGHGQSHRIEITFTDAVEKVEITAHDPTFGGNTFEAHDAAGFLVGTKYFIGNNAPGVYSANVQTIESSAADGSIAWIALNAVPGEYLAYSMRVQFKKNNGCKVPATMYAQGTLPWGPQIYARSKSTIHGKGCAMTSMAMGMSAHGTNIDPGALNALMLATPNGYLDTTIVNWDVSVRAASRNSVDKLTYRPIDSDATMKKALCAGDAVVVAVKWKKGKKSGKLYPGHFVLVNEVKGDGTFWIQDPAGGISRPLSYYPGYYEVRGAIVKVKPKASPPPATTSLARSSLSAVEAAPDDSALVDVIVKNGSLTVTASDGSRSVAGAADDNVAGIPGSFARTDGLTNDDDSLNVDENLVFTVSVPATTGAQYSIEVIPNRLGRDTVLVQTPSPTTGEMQMQRLPYIGVPGVAVRFVVTVGAEGMTASRAPATGVFILPFCDLRHAILNLGATAVDARYLVEETGETGTIHLAARGPRQLFSITELRTTTQGTLRLSTLSGALIVRLAALTSCPH